MPESILNHRQRIAFVHTAAIWTLYDYKTGVPGELVSGGPIQIYEGEPCRYVFTSNVDTAIGLGRVKTPGPFTRDACKFAANLKIQNGDFIVNTTKGSQLYGQCHKIQGAAQIQEGANNRVNQQIFECMGEEDIPAEILHLIKPPVPVMI